MDMISKYQGAFDNLRNRIEKQKEAEKNMLTAADTAQGELDKALKDQESKFVGQVASSKKSLLGIFLFALGVGVFLAIAITNSIIKPVNQALELSRLSTSSVQIAEEAGGLLKKMVPDIQKTAELVQEINASTQEQSSGAEQINKAIQQLDQVIQQNASSSEELASTSEQMNSQADQLKQTMGFFRTREKQTNNYNTSKTQQYKDSISFEDIIRPEQEVKETREVKKSRMARKARQPVPAGVGGGNGKNHDRSVYIDLGELQDGDFVSF